MTLDILGLPWLTEKSDEARSLLADASALQSAPLETLAMLAQCRLTASDTRKLCRTLAGRKGATTNESGFACIRVCLASQTTAEFLADELILAGLRFGLLIDIVATEFNQLADLAFGNFFDDERNAGVDFTFLALDYRQLGFRLDSLGCPDQAEQDVEDKLAFVRGIVDGIRSRTRSPCVVQNLVPQAECWNSSFDRGLAGTASWQVDTFNRRLCEILAGTGNHLFDVAQIASIIGVSRWNNHSMWYLAKLPCSQNVVPYYGHRIAATLAAARGKSKRVLVLDLDNTLWGGVIGDDGVEGIVVGQGSAAGEAHLDIQRMAKRLRACGVVLAVASKNSDDVARKPFEHHSEMLLKLDDFAVFSANWEDKASNILHISKLLELGLDSFVFLDDNPLERDIVRRRLPSVSVPEVGSNAGDYVSIVMSAGYFETVSFGTEDQQRARMYRDNAKRSLQMETVGDLNSYLASLGMRMTLTPFDKAGRSRIAQLINKSNQFNLTTRRYSDVDVETVELDPDTFTLQIRLVDSFGDNGMISVVICRRLERDWEIDTWLMSCRVLNRRVEEQVLQHMVEQALASGITRLKGVFRPTSRNQIVALHYQRLGFQKDPASTETEEIWWLENSGYQTKQLPFELSLPRGQ
ncbi:MAG: haloacid dehalogenase [Hydrocarboniphaga sp.]|uniref:HAD-IIIC family phosphatase n=1 Tax=Hydrocarboniphaga sp. TaxID=2033016 RepID=UPI0026123144|nr:HAD-IIIC family phosphatase [Hydrocarboniphaga sp.]MDB5972505.1 haloacid dehalogenase [Hydrocarboniphaga sp.]